MVPGNRLLIQYPVDLEFAIAIGLKLTKFPKSWCITCGIIWLECLRNERKFQVARTIYMYKSSNREIEIISLEAVYLNKFAVLATDPAANA